MQFGEFSRLSASEIRSGEGMERQLAPETYNLETAPSASPSLGASLALGYAEPSLPPRRA